MEARSFVVVLHVMGKSSGIFDVTKLTPYLLRWYGVTYDSEIDKLDGVDTRQAVYETRAINFVFAHLAISQNDSSFKLPYCLCIK